MSNYIIVDSKGWFKSEFLKLSSPEDSYYYIDDKKDLTFVKLNSLNPRYIFFLHWNWKVQSSIFNNFNCILFYC